jgi:hypothetical protein
MKVSIKDLAVSMDLGNRGVEFEVKDANENHIGDLRISRATIEWCRGRTRSGNGVQKSWEEVIEWFAGGN